MAVIPATIIFAVQCSSPCFQEFRKHIYMNQSKAESIRSALENYRIHEKTKWNKIQWSVLNCHRFLTMAAFSCFWKNYNSSLKSHDLL